MAIIKLFFVFFVGLSQISDFHILSSQKVSCRSSLNRKSCPPGTYYRENTKSLFRCPSCVKLKDVLEDCDILKNNCSPGLKCIDGTCIFDKDQSCDFYKLSDADWQFENYWQPDCLPDGKYAPRQCKGNRLSGKCFCTNEEGTRIFGEKPWLVAENMTCACSRMAEELRKTNRGYGLHCDENGNFEELQCEADVCWCSNERTGIPYTIVVPESMIRALPCFEEKEFGSQYLRRCESVQIHSQRAIKFLKDRGTTEIILKSVNCNYDGSYARVQKKGVKKYCVYKNEKQLTEVSTGTKDCNCAYDQFVTRELRGENFIFDCDTNGSYKSFQTFGNNKFKVDSDGFIYNVSENLDFSNEISFF